MKIGITFSEINYENYPKWIVGNDNVEMIHFSYEKNNIEDLAKCNGIVFSGGVDIKPENINYENAPRKFYPERDDFEERILEKSLELKIPILGICRGLQLINVYFGGSLILDLGETENEIHKKGIADKTHDIEIREDSLLFNISGKTKGEVNSAHHQAVDKLGLGLKSVAESQNGVIEALELENLQDQFLLAVQWHPERMEDQNNPLKKNIREAFLKVCTR